MKRILGLLLFLLLALAVTLGVVRTRSPGAGSGTYPEILSFKVTPQVITPGDSSVLSWETKGAASVAVEWAPEREPRGNMQRRTGLPPSGMMTVQPKEDTVYVLVCETPSGSMCASASATVRIR